MLSDDVCRLLTAYVDGELNERQRQAVERVIQRSPEARQLVDQLQADANTLRKLPRRQLPSDFALQVADAITTRQLRPGQQRLWQPSSKTLAWAGAAASVLLAVGLGSYFLSPARNPRAPLDAVAARAPELAQARAQPMPKEAAPVSFRGGLEKTAAPPSANVATAPVPSEPGPSADDRKASKSMPASAPSKPSDGANKDAGAALAAGPGRSNNLKLIAAGFPLSLSLGELNREEQKKRLRMGMEKGTGYHVELFSRGNGHALERLRAALFAQRISLFVDNVAESRLKRGRQDDYLLYTQEMTAGQLASVLERLASDDKEAEEKRRGSGEFENFTICALGVEDGQALAVFLGGDPLLLPAPGLRGPLVTDLHKPLPERAAGAANRSSLAPNGTPRSGLDRPLAWPPEHSALLIPYEPGRPKAITSIPVRQFLSNRKPPQQGAVQVFLVLRRASG
jgi:negative regulator of sigma E activity